MTAGPAARVAGDPPLRRRSPRSTTCRCRCEPGEVVGLLGANGAGKTTLIRMLLGLLGTSAGTRRAARRPARSRERRRRLGYVPQNLGLYRDLTVRENLTFVAGAYGAARPACRRSCTRYADVLVGELPLGAQRQVAFLAALCALARGAAARRADVRRRRALPGPAVGHHPRAGRRRRRRPGDDALHAGGPAVRPAAADVRRRGSSPRAARPTSSATRPRSPCTPTTGRAAFAALNAAGAPVILDGRAVRVADADPAELQRILDAAGIAAPARAGAGDDRGADADARSRRHRRLLTTPQPPPSGARAGRPEGPRPDGEAVQAVRRRTRCQSRPGRRAARKSPRYVAPSASPGDVSTAAVDPLHRLARPSLPGSVVSERRFDLVLHGAAGYIGRRSCRPRWPEDWKTRGCTDRSALRPPPGDESPYYLGSFAGTEQRPHAVSSM